MADDTKRTDKAYEGRVDIHAAMKALTTGIRHARRTDQPEASIVAGALDWLQSFIERSDGDWISVDALIPPVGVRLLFVVDDPKRFAHGNVLCGFYAPGMEAGDGLFLVQGGDRFHASHWMTAPAPPRADAEGDGDG